MFTCVAGLMHSNAPIYLNSLYSMCRILSWVLKTTADASLGTGAESEVKERHKVRGKKVAIVTKY